MWGGSTVQVPNKQIKNKLFRPGVNFTNILRAAFSLIFWWKMLVKLTPGVSNSNALAGRAKPLANDGGPYLSSFFYFLILNVTERRGGGPQAARELTVWDPCPGPLLCVYLGHSNLCTDCSYFLSPVFHNFKFCNFHWFLRTHWWGFGIFSAVPSLFI